MLHRILHVVSNVAHYDDPAERTGLWLSELTHAWQVFAARGHEQRLVSPRGGLSPLEPRSLKWPKGGAGRRRPQGALQRRAGDDAARRPL